MAKTDAERRRESDARKRAAGLTRVSIWVPNEKIDELRKIAKAMLEYKKRAEAASKAFNLPNNDGEPLDKLLEDQGGEVDVRKWCYPPDNGKSPSRN